MASRRRPATTTEASVKAQVLATFGAVRWLRLFRQNAGKIQSVESGAWVHLYPEGAADLSGWIRKWDCFRVHPPGRRIEIETKHPRNGRLREAQKRWAVQCKADGVLYIEARSIEDVWKALEEAGYDRD